MRMTGTTKKLKGVVHEGIEEFEIKKTLGYNKYRHMIEEGGTMKIVEGYAELNEMVPVYKSCGTCQRYLAKYEVKMAPYMIAMPKYKDIVNPVTGKKITGPQPKQEYICFECFEEMIN